MQNHPIVKEVGLEDVFQYQTYSNVLNSCDCLYCKNKESSNCKGSRIRGCVSISDLFQCIDFVWLSFTASMQNHPIVKEVGLEEGYQYQTYSNVFDFLWLSYTTSMQNQPIVKEVGLEDM